MLVKGGPTVNDCGQQDYNEIKVDSKNPENIAILYCHYTNVHVYLSFVISDKIFIWQETQSARYVKSYAYVK